MSVTALMHVARIMKALPKGVTPTAKLVLVALADRHNQETGRCDPSIETLAADIGVSERAVRDGIRQLEKVRAIKTEWRKISTGRGRRNLTNRYRILGFRGGAGFAGRMGQDLPTNHTTPDTQTAAIPSAFDDLAMLIETDHHALPSPGHDGGQALRPSVPRHVPATGSTAQDPDNHRRRK